MAPQIGQPGHVSFRLLVPAISPVTGQPLAETVPSGETACQAAVLVAVNPDGTVNAGGWNARGEPRQWVAVRLGAEPVVHELDANGDSPDPAGHVFHLAADCPKGR